MVKLYKFKCFDLDHLNPLLSLAWFGYFDIALVQSVGAHYSSLRFQQDGYLIVRTILFF